MEQKRMDEIIQGVLVNSTQLAFVEEAYGTLALLENANEVFRYFVNNTQSVTLFNELEIFIRYLAILKVRYDDRFSVNFANGNSYKSIFIAQLSVISFFDSILISYLEQNKVYIDFIISFEVNGNNIHMMVIVLTDKQEYYHEKILS